LRVGPVVAGETEIRALWWGEDDPRQYLPRTIKTLDLYNFKVWIDWYWPYFREWCSKTESRDLFVTRSRYVMGSRGKVKTFSRQAGSLAEGATAKLQKPTESE
jgi:hypothetical protein